MKGKAYEQRLQLLNITTLEKRRQRGDLIEVYKIPLCDRCAHYFITISMVEADTMNAFKYRLDKYWSNQDGKCYFPSVRTEIKS